MRDGNAQAWWDRVAEVMRPYVAELSKATFHRLAAPAHQDPKWRQELARSLRQPGVPEVMRHAVRRDQPSGRKTALFVGMQAWHELVETYGPAGSVAEAIANLGEVAENEPALATVWLLDQYATHPDDRLTAVLLAAESPWQAPEAADLTGEVPAEAVALVERTVADGPEGVDEPRLFADLADPHVRAWLGAPVPPDPDPVTETEPAGVAPTAGNSHEAVAAAAAEEAAPASEAPPVRDPEALAATDWAEAADAAERLQALRDGARWAAERAQQELACGAAPSVADVTWLLAVRTAANALGELAGDTTGSLMELLERTRRGDPVEVALDRLTEGDGPHAADLREAVAHAREGAADAGALVELVELVDAGEGGFGAWMRLARRLPEGLEDALEALRNGDLVLPSQPAPTGAGERQRPGQAGTADSAATGAAEQPAESKAPADRPPAAPELDASDTAGEGKDGQTEASAPPSEQVEVAGVDDEPDAAGSAGSDAGHAAAATPATAEPTESTDPVAAGDVVHKAAESDEGQAEARAAIAAQAERLLTDCLRRTEHAPGAAYWAARAAGWGRRARAAQALAWARLVSGEESPTAAALHEVSERLDDDLGDAVARPLLIAAAVRAGVAAPYLSLNLVETVAGALDERSVTGQLAAAVRDATYQGVRADAVADSGHQAVERAAAEAADRAGELLAVAEQRKLGYQPATRVYHRWTDAEDEHGWLGRLLTVAAEDARDRLGEVDAELQTLERDLTGQLLRRMQETDAAERDTPGIAHHARDALVRRAASHLEVVRDWADAARRLRLAPASPPEHTRQRLAELAARREEIDSELARGAADPAAASAAELAGRVVEDVLTGLEQGRLFTRRGSEQPDWLLAVPLLATRVEIDTATLQPEREPTLDDLERMAGDADWETVFADRLAAEHLGEASAIADVVAEADEVTAERLRGELASTAELLQHRLAARHSELGERLTALRHEGLVEPAEAERLAVELDRFTPAGQISGEEADHDAPRRGSQADRGDVAGALRRLEQLADEMERARQARIEDTREWLHARAATSEAVNVRLPQLESWVEQGRLPLVETHVSELAAGNEPADLADDPSTLLTEADSRILADAPPLDQELSRAARRNGEWHELSFARHYKADRDLVGSTVSSWLQLDSADTGAAPGNIRTVCRALGMEVERRGVAIDTDRGRAGVRWYTVAGSVPDAAAAAVGSQARHWQVIVTGADADPDKALAVIAAADRRPDEAIVHLHLGGLGLTARSDYAHKLRHRDGVATPVLLVDAGVMACRLARRRADGWQATCHLTLPFANVNPYRRDVGGQIAREEFFGRRRHRDELLDPNGPVLLYGGRKLGKTALLNKVRETAAGMVDTAGVLADLQQVGRSKPAEAVWAEIADELARAGYQQFVELAEPDAVAGAIEARLAEAPSDRLLILLDEADAFLAADADGHHTQIDRLRRLMRRTDGRCKFVLAGLHHVTRFDHGENQQLPNLGRAIGIGGMETRDAEQLVRYPLQALGWELEATSVHQVLVRTNFHPTLLQRFGYELAEKLHRARPEGPPPWRVPAQEVDDTLRAPEFVANVRDIVRLTAELDVRYAALTYALALAAGDSREVVALTVRELLDELRTLGVDRYLPTLNELETRHLLEEMELLGLVRWDGHHDHVELRNTYLSRMLGSPDELLAALADLADLAGRQQPLESAADHQRRGIVDVAGRPWPAPLTDRQAAAASEGGQVTALVCSPALIGGEPATVLSALDAQTGATVLHGRKLGRTSAGAPPHTREDLRRLVWADLRGQPAAAVQRALHRADEWAAGLDIPGSTAVLVLVDASRPGVLRQLHAGQLGRATVVGADRLDAGQAARFAADCGVELDNPEALHAATSGWPWLVSAAVDAARAGGRPMDRVAQQTVADQLAATSREQRLEAFGLARIAGEDGGAGARLLDTLAELGGGSADAVVRLAFDDDAPRAQRERAHRELEVLALLGVVAHDHDGSESTVTLDPVVAQHVWTPQPATRR
jgi:hypothetical protein